MLTIAVCLWGTFHSSKGYAGGTDTIPPVIKLYGPLHDSVPIYTVYTDRGYEVSDTYYPIVKVDTSGTFVSTFNDNFANKLGTYTLIYTAIDGSGNKASATRYIKVYENIPPSTGVLRLIGPMDVNICRFGVYKDLGYAVDTPYYSSIKVDTSGSFFSNGTSKTGLCYLTYTAKDTFGNSVSVTRMINVEPSGSYGCNSSIINVSSDLKDIKFYPNPASDNIFIDAGGQEISGIQIVDELGKQVFSQISYQKGIIEIPVSGLSSGIYTVIISSENGTVVKQVLKN